MFTMKYGLAPDRYEWHTSVFTIALGFGLLAGSVIGTIISKKVKPHFLMSIPIFIAGLLIFVLGYTNVLGVYYAAALPWECALDRSTLQSEDGCQRLFIQS